MSDDARKGTRRRRGTAAVSLGQWMRRERMNQQLTQTELAARASLSRSYVCNIERGYDIQPSIEALDRLGAALSVSRSEILAAAGILEPVGGVPSDDRDARIITLLRSLNADDRDAVERFARFLQAEERRWNQPRLIEEVGRHPVQDGPTLFDVLDGREDGGSG